MADCVRGVEAAGESGIYSNTYRRWEIACGALLIDIWWLRLIGLAIGRAIY